jgi:hypothetical protein
LRSIGSKTKPAPADSGGSPKISPRMNFVILDELGYLPFVKTQANF